MCKLKYIRDNGCFPHQKLISCAIEHNRLHEVYGLGKVVYVCANKQDVDRFVRDVHPESGIQLLSREEFGTLAKGVDTVYIESSEKFSVSNTMHSRLMRLGVSSIITDKEIRKYNV